MADTSHAVELEHNGEVVTNIELRDVNMELFDIWFNTELLEGAFYVPGQLPYVLVERSQVHKFSCIYLLARGDDERDIVLIYAVQLKMNELFVRVAESYGVIMTWIRILFDPEAVAETAKAVAKAPEAMVEVPEAVAKTSDEKTRKKLQRVNALGLTPRQDEVARMFGSGMTARAIAEQLFISEATVNNHLDVVRQELKRRLSVSDRSLSFAESRIHLRTLGYCQELNTDPQEVANTD